MGQQTEDKELEAEVDESPEEESADEAAEEKSALTREADDASEAERGMPASVRDATEGSQIPGQLGTTRFVYAGYFGGAIGVAFMLSKIIDYGWYKLSTYQPQVGEPVDEIVFPASGLIGALIALYYWRKQRTRRLAEEVAEELSKVTWPTKKEVTNSTTVVIVTTAMFTVFFALMDRFWGFVTNLVYGT